MNTLDGNEVVALIVVALLGVVITWLQWLVYKYRREIKRLKDRLNPATSPDAQIAIKPKR